jgi:ribose transport system ATP-binding protein
VSALPARGRPVIEADGVRKVYGGTVALMDASLRVRAGEIHALLGENGAGKSTLVRLLAGLEQPDGGSIAVLGEPPGAATGGAAFIHQDLGLVESMSVADNVALVEGYPRRWRVIDRRATDARARAALERLDVRLDVARPVGELPIAEQAIVAIARALAGGARLIVLDEPTANLHAAEVRSLFALLSRLRDQGVACVLITHRTDEVPALADRVTVMRDGRTVTTRPARDLSQADLVSLITGREAAAAARSSCEDGPPLLSIDSLCGRGFGPVSFTVCERELLALTGLADAGHRALAGALYGLDEIAAGACLLGGAPYRPRDPRAALAAGVAYVPADRRSDGLALKLTARENFYMAPAGGAAGILRRGRERSGAVQALVAFAVRPPAPERVVETFSGGNQQKILLARCLGERRRLVILNEPTGAVDIGAKYEIYSLLRERCQATGCAALVVTSDFEEAATLCDRAVVMRRGEVAGVVDDGRLSAITALAYGGEVTS